MTHERPDPNQLLARLQAGEVRERRGKLKIFFGYAAGVGKTYAMLEAAHREKADGVDVVVGYVEPHGRAETEALLEGLEAIPFRQIAYRGVTIREFDLDAALARRPQLLLVDELAHTNAEGSRHVKRWQDVEELLNAGISVYTSLNVQHIESLNDVVAQITGVIVQETLPDAVLETADEFELVDLSPDDLIDRLKAGRVYVPTQAERALRHFFQEGNLTALRELSLLQAANRLKKDLDAARQDRSATTPWGVRERLLVCISASPTTVKLIRRARRMAAAFGAEWFAVAVDTHGNETAASTKERIAKHLRLAEQLGAETQHLVGANVADAVLNYARQRNVTKIVVGKTAQPWWRRLFQKTVVDRLLEGSGDIDVYVIRGDGERTQEPNPQKTAATPIRWSQYARAALVIALCGSIGAVFHEFQLAEANLIMVFLLGIAFVASRYGRGPAIFAAIASVLFFDFFFVPPLRTFTVNDSQYILTFAVMLTIGLLISTLTTRIRAQLESSQLQERRTAALYRLTKQMSEVAGPEFLVLASGAQLGEMFPGEVVVYLRQPDGKVELAFGAKTSVAAVPVNAIVAQWVIEHHQPAGMGTDTLPNATALFVPLVGSQHTMGAIGVRPAEGSAAFDPDRRRLLETAASLIALSLERDQSVLEASQAQLQIQTEQLRSSLLSSVSHDLRTPLAAIGGAASSLMHEPDEQRRKELLETVVEESHRLSRLVDNLLDMTRLESGVRLNMQWHVLEEIFGTALRRLRKELAKRLVRVTIPNDMPLVRMDGLLMEQVVVNLLENASRYTPIGSEIEIRARRLERRIEISVSDNGPGLAPGTERQVFEKFFRGATGTPDGRRGVGLGLAICQAIVHAHEGTIVARNRPEGGAEFVITLPCKEEPPSISLDELPANGP